MTTTYQAFVWETKEDIDRLQSSKYNLQVAKSVANPDGKPSFNVIYASHILGPNMSVSWTTQYGLNWTTDIPDPGAKVTYSGHWQPCSLGQSFDIDDDGFFVENDNNPDARDDSLNIGSNNYGDPDGVNIIIGVQDSKGDWNPVCGYHADPSISSC